MKTGDERARQRVALAVVVALTAACSRRGEDASGAGRLRSSLSEEIPRSSLPFVSLSFDEALVRARAERKLVFVDLYADWCTWCTRMDEDVFTDARVRTALLDFVPIKVNADKGGGRGIASRYRVDGLPTFLLVNGDGEVVRRFDGYLPAEAFLRKLGPASGALG